METTHAPFSITLTELEYWEKRNRGNNYFELVYIVDGEGAQCVNYSRSAYRKDSIFLLPASDCHTYEIEKKTTFLFIRFTANYFAGEQDTAIDLGKWFCRLNFILGNYNRLPGDLITNPDDKAHIIRLLDFLRFEQQRRDAHTHRIIQSTMVIILELIVRNVAAAMPNRQLYEGNRFAEMLLHINYHLLDEEQISPQYLCRQFNIAPTYFSEYFKRNAQETYQEFVLRSKLKLAEAKALYTDIPFKEIAYDLGFTDSSHLNKMMKRFYRKGMREIRKAATAA
ncbi:AraC family transcriptional regulator [Chitinophaga nivalis]|uniref:Helix-turn-helix transcriptional regulator n=1 Tax=Chitinophaga nivalis TaxID=2991709 RepID=A0ABT3ITL5_9BACT|nr:helix-turn-helix transcriptional regulator [Chitinophaga nivalis]MCW3462971.1 helix-turn-helix transcriptional regulator [Chitinophaga nivalis]MCW3487339.1 helix-turn-helix transcriptional regulator [Chitinophaga nivalis]